ncbi:MAG: methyl-accepting chemotaxis protein [Noviherbaspirillum sp.]
MQSCSVPVSPVRHGAAEILPGEVFGRLINLSGRRRFTSQRLVLYAVLAAQGKGEALAVSRSALALFDGAHASLLHRSRDLPGVYCEPLREAYFGAAQGDARIRGFSELARRTLDAIESGWRQAAELLAQLIDITTPLLETLNSLTAVYEEESRRHALLLEKRRQSVMQDIEAIAREARMVAFNAQVIAARAGASGREFAVVGSRLSDITGQIDALVRQAMEKAA